MGLLTYGGSILSPLSNDPDCCCGADVCPNCCIKITSGTLVDGQIKIFVVDGARSMDVTITTPSGTRVVCNDEEITIAFEFTAPPEDDATLVDAVATWDAIWRFSTSSPLPSSVDGSTNEYGHINWGSIADREYSVTLKLFTCLLEYNPSLGLITVGSLEWPMLTVDIEIEVCNLSGCCGVEVPCENCCFYLEEGWAWNDTDGWWEQYTSGADFDLLVTIEMGDPPLACIDLDEVVITLHVVTKDKATNTAALFNTVITTENWPLREPAGDDPERPVGFKGDVIWTGASSKSYQIKIAPTCDDLLGADAGVSWTIEKAGGAAGFGGGAAFIACALSEDCICCCPDHCCWDCHFPVREDFCDTDGLTDLYDDSSPTRITGLSFLTEYSPSATCEDGVNTYPEVLQSQVGLSSHRVACTLACSDPIKRCGRSVCQFIIPMKIHATTCPDSEDTFYTAELTYVSPGLWALGTPGGVGSVPVYVGCDGGTFEVTFTSGIYTITRTITFTVERDMPANPPTCPEPDDEEGG